VDNPQRRQQLLEIEKKGCGPTTLWSGHTFGEQPPKHAALQKQQCAMLAPLRGKHANRRTARQSLRPRFGELDNEVNREPLTGLPRKAGASSAHRNRADAPHCNQAKDLRGGSFLFPIAGSQGIMNL
jgi:hypothetical protein